MPRTPAFFSPHLDKKIRPQDDIFQYATKAWAKAHPIPKSQSAWSTFNVLDDEVQHQLKSLLDKLAKSRTTDPEAKKLREYYRAGMDEKLANKLGAEPVLEELARIDAIDSRAELPALMAHLHNLGAGPFWDWCIGPDYKKNTINIVELYQSGLGLPDRDYYIKNDAKSKKIRVAYLKTIARLMKLAGWSASESAAIAKTVFEIETRLAKASMSRVELRDIPAQYNKMSPAALQKTANFDWKGYLDAVGIPTKHVRTLIACQPKFMKESAAILKKTSLDDLKAYLSWHLVLSAAPYLSDEFVKASFDFYGKVISGKKEQRPRWKRVISDIDDSIGELLGKRYVKEYFPESAKKRVDALIDDLFATYRARMTALPWMSVKTMAKAIEKLDAMRRKIGYPTKWENYAAFKPDSSSFLAMSWAATRYGVKREIKKLGKPVDRNEWGMTPQTVNAYCSFTFNEIVFPAAFLQKPFFHKDWSDALNYGGLGSVIGHELTHAFDDQGSGFDKDGNLKNWWSKADKVKFDAEAKRFVKQYGAYEVVDGLKCNGELTLGENIADVGGLAIAYEALERRLGKKLHVKSGGFTPAQEFFIANAQGWGGNMRPEERRRRVITDPHAPHDMRVNVAFSNLQEFHDAFDVKPGDKLYRKPADRVGIW